MLTNERRQKIEAILQSVTNEINGLPENEYYITMADIQMLAQTVIWMDDRYNEHEDCCISPCVDADIIKKLKLEIEQLKGNA